MVDVLCCVTLAVKGLLLCCNVLCCAAWRLVCRQALNECCVALCYVLKEGNCGNLTIHTIKHSLLAHV